MVFMPADRVVDKPLTQLIEFDASRASRVGEKRELGEARNCVHL